jgi:hypothetical protein
MVGGLKYVLLYLVILLIIPWDVIFGKIVFGGWFADTPSISLPKIGWVHLPLFVVMIFRLLLLLLVIVIVLFRKITYF